MTALLRIFIIQKICLKSETPEKNILMIWHLMMTQCNLKYIETSKIAKLMTYFSYSLFHQPVVRNKGYTHNLISSNINTGSSTPLEGTRRMPYNVSSIENGNWVGQIVK